jgi:hypothetical protein
LQIGKLASRPNIKLLKKISPAAEKNVGELALFEPMQVQKILLFDERAS